MLEESIEVRIDALDVSDAEQWGIFEERGRRNGYVARW